MIAIAICVIVVAIVAIVAIVIMTSRRFIIASWFSVPGTREGVLLQYPVSPGWKSRSRRGHRPVRTGLRKPHEIHKPPSP
eukprot:11537096-Karenia_brevis.AAC.1